MEDPIDEYDRYAYRHDEFARLVLSRTGWRLSGEYRSPRCLDHRTLRIPFGYPYQVYQLGSLSQRAEKALCARIAHYPELFEAERSSKGPLVPCADLSECIQRHRRLLCDLKPVEWHVGCGYYHRHTEAGAPEIEAWYPPWTRTFFAVDEESALKDPLTTRRFSGFVVDLDGSKSDGSRTLIRAVTINVGRNAVDGLSGGFKISHYERFPGLKFNQTVENIARLMAADQMGDPHEIVEPHWILE